MIKPYRYFQYIVFVLTAVLTGATHAQPVVITPLKPSGIYDVGEKISWKIEVRGAPTFTAEPNYSLKLNELTTYKQGIADFSKGPATIETSLDQPGMVFLELATAPDATPRPAGRGATSQPVRSLAGALVAPEIIALSQPRPDDFEAFWAGKIESLNRIPINPQIEPADSGNPNVEYAKVRIDNINDTHIYGQIARPRVGEKFPAILRVQSAGVYGLPKSNVVDRANQGWLALNIMPHDIPLDQPAEFYTQLNQGALKDYFLIGNDDREKSYFLRMYLSCYRAIEYLSQRPDWDGKTLVVMGTSQGGQQALVTAGMNPKVTAMLALVPAGCDTTGNLAGRFTGFPYWAREAAAKNNDKILEVSRYYDATNFAMNIKCPGLVGLGLIDETCPPAGVYTAINQLKGPKEVIVMIESAHVERNGSQAAYNRRAEEWLAALVKGESPK